MEKKKVAFLREHSRGESPLGEVARPIKPRRTSARKRKTTVYHETEKKREATVEKKRSSTEGNGLHEKSRFISLQWKGFFFRHHQNETFEPPGKMRTFDDTLRSS